MPQRPGVSREIGSRNEERRHVNRAVGTELVALVLPDAPRATVAMLSDLGSLDVERGPPGVFGLHAIPRGKRTLRAHVPISELNLAIDLQRGTHEQLRTRGYFNLPDGADRELGSPRSDDQPRSVVSRLPKIAASAKFEGSRLLRDEDRVVSGIPAARWTRAR
jgi:hypothetical protein